MSGRNVQYPINGFLMNLSELLFDLDKSEKTILGIIAKYWPLNELQISEFGFKQSHTITRDVVRYRLNSSKNPSNLIESDFVIKLTGKRIGNLKNKEKIYFLTFKGFLVSLSRTKFNDCYLVKKYLNFMPKWTYQYHIPNVALTLIKFDLALFMLKYVMIGSRFTHAVDIDTNRDSLNYDDPLTDPNFTPQTMNAQYDSALFDIRFWYHVYSQVLNKLLEKAAQDKLYSENEGIERVSAYINFWYQWFLRAQFNSIPFTSKQIPLDMESQIMSVGRTISIKGANIEAKRILRSFGLKPKFQLDEKPLFFT